MKLFWMILAGTCIMVAAVFLLRRNFDAAFVTAVLGLVAWFLNYRAQISGAIAAEDQEASTEEEESYEGSSDE